MTNKTLALAAVAIATLGSMTFAQDFGRRPQVGPLTHPNGFVRTVNGVVSANPPSVRVLPDGSLLRNDGVRIPRQRRANAPIPTGNGGFVSANPPSVVRLPDGRLLHSNGEITNPRANAPRLPANALPPRELPIKIINLDRNINVNYVLDGQNHTAPAGRSITHVRTANDNVRIVFGSGLGFLRRQTLRPGAKYVFRVSAENGWQLFEL